MGKKSFAAMKKIFAVGMVLFLLTGCATKSVAHEHSWADATCTAPKTCLACGETEGEALGHKWVEATCTTPKTCSVCGETEGEALGHKWVEATCTAPKTCSVCGKTEGEALGHKWVEATCTTPKTCSICGEIEGEALGHKWVEATCTTPKSCSACGETEGEALGHDAPDLSCTQDGTCLRCGAVIPALGHDWIDATCTTPKTCSRCAITDGKALGHSRAEAVKENEKAATCTDAGSYDEVVYCSVCKEELSRTTKTEKALGHIQANAVKENKKAATCTEEGSYDEVVYCSRCHTEISRKTVKEPALGHTTSSGVCSRCKREIYQTVTGKGDDVLTDISVGDGIYKVRFTNSGRSNFVVWVYDSTDDRDLAVNEIGNYDGYYLLMGTGPYMFEIESHGTWSYTIERIGYTDATSFKGHGCYVTEMFPAKTGKWHITHDGKSNFVIWLWTTDGRDLLVNEIGKYEGNKLFSIPSESNAMLVIEADGNWIIEPVK